jgi:serine/threonine protein kinase
VTTPVGMTLGHFEIAGSLGAGGMGEVYRARDTRLDAFVVGASRITSFDDARIEVLRVSDRSRHRLIDGGTAPQYLPTGHLAAVARPDGLAAAVQRHLDLAVVEFGQGRTNTSRRAPVMSDSKAR